MTTETDILQGIQLMRAGERETSDPAAGLSKGSRHDVRGERYITDAIKCKELKLPTGQIFSAPTRICRETRDTIIRTSRVLCLTSEQTIEEKTEIHFNRTDEAFPQAWAAILQNAAQGEGIKTLADLIRAEQICLKDGLIHEGGFLAREGERILNFLLAELKNTPRDSIMLCILHSPLPEAVMLRLWETKIHPVFRAAKGAEAIPALKFLDSYCLLFRNGRFINVTYESYEEEVSRFREREALKRDPRTPPER